ncbi:MAG: TolC family protein [Ignavibacteriales bacterium]|nr:TolC family protein [Ignavibacteriales bacterium]
MRLCRSTLIIILSVLVIPSQKNYAQENNSNSDLTLTLNQCIEKTLQNHNSRAASKFAVQAAEAQLKQARSGHYPKLDLSGSYSLMDQNPNFVMPAMNISLTSIDLGTFTLNLPPFTFPAQNIKMADMQMLSASLDVLYPLFTGGKISAYISEAEAGLDAVKEDLRATDAEIIFQTKKLYYAVVLTTKLEEIATEAYERLNSTLDLTESLYQKGSGKVTKSDYLKNKTMVEVIKSIVAQISGERRIALAALVNAIGLEWQTRITITENEIPFSNNELSLNDLINTATESNPMIMKVGKGLKVYESRIDEAKSDYYPSVALFGSYRKIISPYDAGIMTAENKNIWIVGLGVQLSIFNGYRTSGQIEEATANYKHLNEQKELLRKGITLKIQYLYNKILASKGRESASKEAMLTSSEDRELVEKAYFSEIMELKDVMQAQITESMMKAQYQIILYEALQLYAEMELVLANNIHQ